MSAARVAAIVAAMVAASGAPAHADHQSDGELVGVGLLMALPAYALGVTIHEGSHALAAEAVGGDTLELHLYPGRNPHNGAFQFGWTRVRGIENDRERVFFLMAPKLVDLAMLGGYGALLATGSLPGRGYGLLTLQVLATGFWVDFAKDALSFSRFNDVVKVMTIAGLDTEWKRLPARVVYAAAGAALGYLVFQGYQDLFAENDEATASAMAPLFTTTF